MRVYATPQQLQTYLGAPPPEDASRLLWRASTLIEDHTITATYAVDTTGLPTDTTVKDAFADAVCAQVEFWLAGDEEDDILGPVQSVGLPGMQEQHGPPGNRPAPMYLAPRAARHLRAAGLLSGAVWSS